MSVLVFFWRKWNNYIQGWITPSVNIWWQQQTREEPWNFPILLFGDLLAHTESSSMMANSELGGYQWYKFSLMRNLQPKANLWQRNQKQPSQLEQANCKKEKKELLELQSTNGTYVTFQTSNSNLQMISATMFLKKKKLNPRDKQIDMKNTHGFLFPKSSVRSWILCHKLTKVSLRSEHYMDENKLQFLRI